MRRFVTLLSLALLAPLAVEAAPTTVSVVNIQTIMRESVATKSVREQLEAKQKAYQAEISKQEQALQKEEQELAKQQSALSKEAFEEKVKAFRTKATSMQKEVQVKKATLDGAYEQSLAQVQKTMEGIISELAKEKGFNICIPSSQLIFAEPSLDITADVLKRLNEKLPNYTVKFEAPAAKK